ncbi:hypothetical protein LTR56_005963 [Elasticomyces elasticus]|nr:hypothetical protein LTR56_005963 [Elasticomyces elasticus]KAK3669077.1 hypothetical protein LTR22_000156 [Elasticomyces elasticus]KAK4920958.1 hypothetical protein LTR49_011502 [Elasticomyces elasticus]KAK5759537.1 hypothetical protein LTS12_010395 [Elasticomyces elasticus]
MQNKQDIELPRIFKLPAELRNRIWEFALTDPLIVTATNPYFSTPGITRTCRQARKEALGIWLLGSSFQIVVQDCDMAWFHETYEPSMMAVLRSARKLGAVKKLSNLSEDYMISDAGAPHWGNLVKSLKVYHKISPVYTHCPFHDGSTTMVKVIMAAYGTVGAMHGQAWAEVEKRLEEWHIVLVAMDTRWT